MNLDAISILQEFRKNSDRYPNKFPKQCNLFWYLSEFFLNSWRTPNYLILQLRVAKVVPTAVVPSSILKSLQAVLESTYTKIKFIYLFNLYRYTDFNIDFDFNFVRNGTSTRYSTRIVFRLLLARIWSQLLSWMPQFLANKFLGLN